MRAIIIQDTDAANLLDLLKLAKWEAECNTRGTMFLKEDATQREITEAIHGRFRYIVCRWLQEHGATVIR